MPDPQTPDVHGIAAVGTWLVTTFGPTEAILIAIASLFLGVTMGWMPSPMMTTMQAIHEDELKRASLVAEVAERVKLDQEERTNQTVLLREICIRTSATDAQKAECWK